MTSARTFGQTSFNEVGEWLRPLPTGSCLRYFQMYAKNQWSKQSTWLRYTSHTLSMEEGEMLAYSNSHKHIILQCFSSFFSRDSTDLRDIKKSARFDNTNTQKLMEGMP